MDSQTFVERVTQIARKQGHKIEVNRDGITQIDFGNKKLHAGHLQKLFPAILAPEANVASLIEAVAPGRPCTHRPMKEIVRLLANT